MKRIEPLTLKAGAGSTKITLADALKKDAPGGPRVEEYTLHGDRTMYAPREAGYNLEGRVSIGGVKRSAFTSSIMFEIQETGQLVSVAVIHAGTPKEGI